LLSPTELFRIDCEDETLLGGTEEAPHLEQNEALDVSYVPQEGQNGIMKILSNLMF
jgi:hypothetical protein